MKNMKKSFLLLPLLTLLTFCSNSTQNESNSVSLSIITPTGAPAVALSCIDDTYLETTSNPNLLKGFFAAETYSVIVAPTDTGVKAIQEGCNYKLAATITFGNFFLVATGNDTDNTIDTDDSIVLFQQNALPDKIFHYVYGNDFNNKITYVNNVQTAANAYQSKEVTTADGNKIPADYVLLAEPKVTALGIETSKIIDLSAKFKEKAQNSNLHQASVFISNKFDGHEFLENLKSGIEEMKADKQVVINNMNKVSDPQTFYGMPSAVAANCMAKGTLGIDFKYAKDSVDSIKNYLSILGMENVDEEVIYQ